MSQEKRQREDEDLANKAQTAAGPHKARKDELRGLSPAREPGGKPAVQAAMVFNSRAQVEMMYNAYKAKTLSFASQAYCWLALEKNEKAMPALSQLGVLRLTRQEVMLPFESDKVRVFCLKSKAGDAERLFEAVLADFVKENGFTKPLNWNERTVPLMEQSAELSFPTFRAKEVPVGRLHSEKDFAGCIAVTNFPEKAGMNQLLTFGSVKALSDVLAVFTGPYTIPASNNKVTDLAVLEFVDVSISLEMQLENLKAKKVGFTRKKVPILAKDCIVAVNVQRYENTGRIVSAVVALSGTAAVFAKKKEQNEANQKGGAFKFNDYLVRLAKAPEITKEKEKEPQAMPAAAASDPDEKYYPE
jgi:hypothetical protein